MGACGLAATRAGMGVDDGGRGVEAGIGDAPDANLAVVVGHMLEQELDGVVGVGGVVDILRRFLFVDVGTHLDELAFAHPAAAHILVDEDVAAVLELVAKGRGASDSWSSP